MKTPWTLQEKNKYAFQRVKTGLAATVTVGKFSELPPSQPSHLGKKMDKRGKESVCVSEPSSPEESNSKEGKLKDAGKISTFLHFTFRRCMLSGVLEAD